MNSVLSIDYDNKVVTAEVDGKNTKNLWKITQGLDQHPIIPPIKGVEIVPGNCGIQSNLKIFQLLN